VEGSAVLPLTPILLFSAIGSPYSRQALGKSTAEPIFIFYFSQLSAEYNEPGLRGPPNWPGAGNLRR
jgi:hypothetical protein